ncbi:MAG: hypothetical protein ACI4RA_03645 [Kiritimatiellia bacterium]
MPTFLWAVCLGRVLFAGEIAVGPQGASPFPDTEVATNIALNARRDDVRTFDVRVELAVSASNCVQVAFGRDADGDGELAPEETGFVLGWRAGRWFVEDVAGGVRRFESVAPAADGTARFLHMRVETDASFAPRRAAFENDAGACFADIASECPLWLFRRDWNLLRATRRGVVLAGEVCRVRGDYRSFGIVFR